ncbi:MAG: COX15/CtaA family protein [Saprospiraceae bacterium]
MEFGVYRKYIKIWLWSGVVMIFAQIILGGITRLTGSGLSITHWDIITGVAFPLSEKKWLYEFNLYQQTPQYQKINFGMSLSDFKFIYFWEYLHRMWARIMGFVFIIPFLFFSFKNLIDRKLLIDLFIVILLAVVVASLGWIMVASGLMNRPWVNAYKLSFHLTAATLLLSYLFWTALKYHYSIDSSYIKLKRSVALIVVLIFIQIFLGGVMSGMKAGLAAPTWPDVNGKMIPQEVSLIFSSSEEILGNYEGSHVSSIIIQFIHRSFAYIIFITAIFMTLLYYIRARMSPYLLFRNLVGIILIQIILGILTLINCIGSIPILFGVLHQCIGILVLLYSIFICFKLSLTTKESFYKPLY